MLKKAWRRVRRGIRTGWFRGRFRDRDTTATVSACILHQFGAGRTLKEFWDQPDLVTETMRLYQTPVWREIMGVMYRERPWGFPVRGEPVTEVQVMVELGRKEGWEAAVRMLERLGSPPRKADEMPLEPDWGVKDEDDELENKHER